MKESGDLLNNDEAFDPDYDFYTTDDAIAWKVHAEVAHFVENFGKSVSRGAG